MATPTNNTGLTGIIFRKILFGQNLAAPEPRCPLVEGYLDATWPRAATRTLLFAEDLERTAKGCTGNLNQSREGPIEFQDQK